MTHVIEPAPSNISTRDLADLLWSTDPHLNAYMFSKMSTLHKLIDSEWPNEKGLFSHKQANAATIDSKIVGLLIDHTEIEYAANFDYSVIHQPAALAGPEAAHMETALYCMDRLFPVPRPESYYILEFAVSPMAQGQGIAGDLFTAATKRAREKGCAQICLDVAVKNNAVGFYRHLGFVTEVETRVPELEENHDIGKHLHMVFDLKSDH